jgi:hypothetical protein
VIDPNYKEFWSDELQLFHNPNAKILLPANWLPDLTQHWFKKRSAMFCYVRRARAGIDDNGGSGQSLVASG